MAGAAGDWTGSRVGDGRIGRGWGLRPGRANARNVHIIFISFSNYFNVLLMLLRIALRMKTGPWTGSRVGDGRRWTISAVSERYSEQLRPDFGIFIKQLIEITESVQQKSFFGQRCPNFTVLLHHRR